MNNKVRNGIIFLVIVALYGGFLLYDTHKPQTGSSPVIKVPKGTLVLDTGMDQTATNQAILEGNGVNLRSWLFFIAFFSYYKCIFMTL